MRREERTTPERWQELKPLFGRALELPLEERARFVTEACGADADLKLQLEALLDSHAGAGSFLEHPVVAAGETVAVGAIGPYAVVRELGRGGMGAVYLAEDSRLCRQVALKILPPAFASDAGRVRRFEQEALAASGLNHPNIVTIYEVGSATGVHYIAAEYIDGETLRERLKRGPMPAREAIGIAIQVARALAAAHGAGIVHRDIKPENVMLRRDGYVKVLDFGIAKVREAPADGVVMGTPAYMAPEQARGEDVDERADIYSFGMLLREMVRPRGRLARITVRATRPAPGRRYQTAAGILRDLERLQRARWRVVVSVAAALAVVALFLWFYWSRPASSGIRMARITGTGRIHAAAISRDGRYLGYADEGLRIRELGTGKEVVLLARSMFATHHIEFSPDNRYLYHTAGFGTDGLWRFAVTGGPAEPVVRATSGQFAFSPDGSQLVFVRQNHPGAGQSALIRADAQGRGERVLSVLRDGAQFQAVAWSPAGNVIACAIEHPENSTLAVLPANGGAARTLGSTRWNGIGRLAWRDRSTLIFTGADAAGFWLTPVWRLRYPSGDVERITPDVGSYDSVSVAGNRIAALRKESSVEVVLAREAAGFRVEGAGTFFDLAWTRDGRILYYSDVTGSLDIWESDPDGGNRRQLTRNAGANAGPTACGGGRYIVFSSNRTGESRVWRMDRDGANPIALTGPGEVAADCSADGRWVVYTDGRGTWTIPIEGGPPRQVVPEPLGQPIFSPDGAFIAGVRKHRVEVVSSTGGPPLYSLDIPRFLTSVKWSPDGRGIDYIHGDKGVDNIWRRPLTGGPPARITEFRSGDLQAFAWSSDGKRLACARVSESSDVVLITGAR